MGLLGIQIWQSSKLLAISVDFSGWKALADDHKSITVNLFFPHCSKIRLEQQGACFYEQRVSQTIGKVILSVGSIGKLK